ncbi:MAG: hypothetical protein GOVbin4296_40 [Prokaryotic dsDNA virus sp.]|nr:MAG: hypothetical protein GOVbin4296_40 [Prokaryotic dsDNA virus sp.]|tara:strand:+ start:151 stop:1725 length:1575 start_codon:yes stop_codon:yes gene_type:complete
MSDMQAKFMDALTGFMNMKSREFMQEDAQKHEVQMLALEIALNQNTKQINSLETEYKTLMTDYKDRGGNLSGLMEINTTGNAAVLDTQNTEKSAELLNSVLQEKNAYGQQLTNAINQIQERLEQFDAVDKLLIDVEPGEDNIFTKEDFWQGLEKNLANQLKKDNNLPINFAVNAMGMDITSAKPGEEAKTINYLDNYVENMTSAEGVAARNDVLIDRERKKLALDKARKESVVWNDSETNIVQWEKDVKRLDQGIGSIINPYSKLIKGQQSFKNYTMAKFKRVQYEQDQGSDMTTDMLQKDKMYQQLLGAEGAALQSLADPLALALGTNNTQVAGQELLEWVGLADAGKSSVYEGMAGALEAMYAYYDKMDDSMKPQYRNVVLANYGIDLSSDGFKQSLDIVGQSMVERDNRRKMILQETIKMGKINSSNPEADIAESWFLDTMAKKMPAIQITMLNILKKYDLYKDITLDDIDADAFQADLYSKMKSTNTTPAEFGPLLEQMLTMFQLDIENGKAKYIGEGNE